MSLDLATLEQAVPLGIENVVAVSEIASTHDLALTLLEGAMEDETHLPTTLIVAESQRAGHGRSGRPWISPHGGLYLSIVRTGLEPSPLHTLPMVAAAAAHRVLTEAGVEASIKWPNDLVAGGGKIGGLIFHARTGEAGGTVVSLGLNVEPVPGLAPGAATCLAEAAGAGAAPPSREALAVAFVRHLLAAPDAAEDAVAAWRRALLHREGDPVEVHLDDGSVVAGTYAGVTAEGHLRLLTGDGERVLSTGDVGLLP